jgi:hypothetical protein
MKASQPSMRSDWGQSIHSSGHNYRPRFWLFRSLYALFTGNRILVCGNGNRVENPPIQLYYKPYGHALNEPRGDKKKGLFEYYQHGFWSHEAGDWFWESAVTKGYVCSNPQCMQWAAENKKDHDEYFADPAHRAEVAMVVGMTRKIGGLDYDLSQFSDADYAAAAALKHEREQNPLPSFSSYLEVSPTYGLPDVSFSTSCPREAEDL